MSNSQIANNNSADISKTEGTPLVSKPQNKIQKSSTKPALNKEVAPIANQTTDLITQMLDKDTEQGMAEAIATGKQYMAEAEHEARQAADFLEMVMSEAVAQAAKNRTQRLAQVTRRLRDESVARTDKICQQSLAGTGITADDLRGARGSKEAMQALCAGLFADDAAEADEEV